MAVRLLIADDYAALRQNIKLLVSRQHDIEVVGEAGDGESAAELAAKLSPDVVLMDVSMPKLSGIEAARKILKNNASARIIIMSTHSEKHFVEAALEAGILGYVLKTSIADDLVPALRSVMAGESFLSPKIRSDET